MTAEKQDPGVHVHLVHGTWPYGLFGKSNIKRPCWFEPGGKLHDTLRKNAKPGTDIQPFLWSGKNGVRARNSAGETLAKRIITVAEKRPGVLQVIIAHSHGGSVATLSMQSLSNTPAGDSLKACICLGTPFAYVLNKDTAGHHSKDSAFAGLISMSYVLFALHREWFGRPISFYAFLLMVVSAVIVFFTVNKVVDWISTDLSLDKPQILSHVEMIVLRSPRDEASLAIGIALALRWIAGPISEGPRSGRIMFIQLILLVAFLFSYRFIQIPFWTELAPGSGAIQVLACVFSYLLVVCILDLTLRFFLGLATGLLNPLDWARAAIEVEPLPLDHPCHAKSYSALYNDEYQEWDGRNLSVRARQLRHSEITRSPDAIQDIIDATRAISRGENVSLRRGALPPLLIGHNYDRPKPDELI